VKILGNWKQTLSYVKHVGVASKYMPISWAQHVIMENVLAIEKVCRYPLTIHYNRTSDLFLIKNISGNFNAEVRVIHR